MPGRHSAPRGRAGGRWLFLGSLLVILGLVGWIGWQLALGARSGSSAVQATAATSTSAATSDAASPSAAATSPTPTTTSPTPSETTASPSRTSATAATPTPRASTTPPTTVTPRASASVVPALRRVAVYNATSRGGYAAGTADRLQAAGWTIVDVGNWSTRPPATTVYYPPGQQASARTLAAEVGATRLRPSTSGMPAGLLVVVLAS